MLRPSASTPIWRSASVGRTTRAQLVAAAVYDHAGADARSLAGGVGTAKAIASGVVGVKAIEASAPAMHTQVTSFLQSQGFVVELDLARSSKLLGGGMVGGQYAFVAPDTAPRPFGQFPLLGPGSKQSIAERLKTDRAREAYASVHVQFGSPGSSLESGVTCDVFVQVLDQSGELVFEGRASTTKPLRGSPELLVVDAFAAALDGMRQPVIEE